MLSQVGFTLNLLGQDPEVSAFAESYTLAYIPGLFFGGLVDLQRCYLNCLKFSSVTLIAVVIG